MRIRLAIALERLKERMAQAIAWHCLPRRVVMWCAVRVCAHATQGPYSSQVVPELLAMEALARWSRESNTSPPATGAGAADPGGPAPGAVSSFHVEREALA